MTKTTFNVNGFEVEISTMATRSTRRPVARPRYMVKLALLIKGRDQDVARVMDKLQSLDKGLWSLCPESLPDSTSMFWHQGGIYFDYEIRPESISDLKKHVKSVHKEFVKHVKSVLRNNGLDFLLEDWPVHV